MNLELLAAARQSCNLTIQQRNKAPGSNLFLHEPAQGQQRSRLAAEGRRVYMRARNNCVTCVLCDARETENQDISKVFIGTVLPCFPFWGPEQHAQEHNACCPEQSSGNVKVEKGFSWRLSALRKKAFRIGRIQ